MEYCIRHMREADLPAIHEMRDNDATRRMLECIPGEPLSAMNILLEGLGRNRHILVAEASLPNGEAKAVGMCILMVESSPERRHTGTIGLTVHYDFQGQGIGKHLMRNMIKFSDEWLMLKRIELTVLQDNHRAISIYQACGFEKEGKKRASVICEGEYADEWIMARIQ